MGAGYNYSYLRRADYLGGDRPDLNKRYDYECHLNSSTNYLLTSSLFICLLFLTILPLCTVQTKLKWAIVYSYKPLSNQQSQPLRPTRFFDSRPGMWTVTVVLLCLSTQLDDKSGHHSDVPGRRSITALADFNQKRLTVADIKAMLITLIRPMVGPLQRAWTAMADDYTDWPTCSRLPCIPQCESTSTRNLLPKHRKKWLKSDLQVDCLPRTRFRLYGATSQSQRTIKTPI